MGKHVFYGLILILGIFTFTSTIWSADEKGQGARMPAGTPTGAVPRRPNFSVIFGNITKIDNTDPAKQKLEVKSDIDGATHVVELTPWTNVTKATDASELKAGDTVRIMARKVETSEVAMTVVFGKIKNIYAPRPTRALPMAAPVKKAPGK